MYGDVWDVWDVGRPFGQAQRFKCRLCKGTWYYADSGLQKAILWFDSFTIFDFFNFVNFFNFF